MSRARDNVREERELPETALICRVPEAERYIARYRDRYDPSARRNVPAHVTMLYPFMPPAHIDADVLGGCATSRAPCRVSSTGSRARGASRWRCTWRPIPDDPYIRTDE